MAGLVLAVTALAELCGRLAFQRGEAERLGVVAGHGVVVVPPLLLIVLLSLLGTAVLGVPGRHALTAMACCAACVVSLAVFGLLTVAAAGALVLAGYRTGLRGPSELAAVLGVPFLVLALARTGWVRTDAIVLAAAIPVAAVAGVARRASGSARQLGAVRAASAGSLTEHMARGERARIARELHDVVAHHISMIAVQAETARLTTPGLPAAGAKRLAEIGDTARAGLTEMRRLLGVLREDAAADTPRRSPQPGLAQLNELMDEARDASHGSVRLLLSGPVVSLDPGTELAVYRIVQEALTNARRHAPGAAVDVELRFGEDVLRVRVRDNGPGGPGTTGHGLLGMRERAAAVGGSLRAGPAEGDGFLVEAEVPVR